jgi:FixJ family two-component response regulator
MQVRTFASGEEFLSALSRSHDVDCSVIDVQMPGMTGLEVQERMNRAGMDVPVIFITAFTEGVIEEKAMSGGAVGFLQKPFTDEALVGLIRIALQRRRKPDACTA